MIPTQPQRSSDLHHQIPTERLQWSKHAIAAPKRIPRFHPLAIRRNSSFLCGIVHTGALVFWMFFISHDPFRRFFVPSRDVPLGVMIAVAVVTLLFLCAWPLRIAVHSMRHGRILISASLQTVLSWTLIGTALVIVPMVSRGATGWLSLVGGVLLVAARLLFVQVKRAFVYDG